MANKTIPDLPEIDLEDVEDTNLLVLETGLVTYKLRLETALAFFFNNQRRVVPVEFDGLTTGLTTVDVSTYVTDARLVQWMLKKPEGGSTLGEQMPGPVIRTPDEFTVTIDTGDFALEAGTYTLLGV